MVSDDITILQVSHHPSGRYTLMRGKKMPFADVNEPGLLGNKDRAGFYRAIAHLMAKMVEQGELFVFKDTES